MGDGVLAFFGAPIAHENDPERAVRAGLAMLREIRPYAAEIARRWDVAFDLRVGINTGLVVVGELIGQGTLFDGAHLMFGEAARGMTLTFGDDYPGFLLAILPPGAFMGLGMLIALKNLIDRRFSRRQPAPTPDAEPATA
mgnify:CR=1 FL=1